MQQKSSNNRRWRRIALFVFLCAGIGLIFSDTWIYRTFPSTCPFSKYLPDGAVATKCEYEGLIDFSVEFQAEGSQAMFQAFVENLKNSLTNPVFLPESPISKSSIKIVADQSVMADVSWENHTISMSYLDY